MLEPNSGNVFLHAWNGGGVGVGGYLRLMEGHVKPRSCSAQNKWRGAEQSLGEGPEQFLMRTLKNAAHWETVAQTNVSEFSSAVSCIDTNPTGLSLWLLSHWK